MRIFPLVGDDAMPKTVWPAIREFPVQAWQEEAKGRWPSPASVWRRCLSPDGRCSGAAAPPPPVAPPSPVALPSPEAPQPLAPPAPKALPAVPAAARVRTAAQRLRARVGDARRPRAQPRAQSTPPRRDVQEPEAEPVELAQEPELSDPRGATGEEPMDVDEPDARACPDLDKLLRSVAWASIDVGKPAPPAPAGLPLGESLGSPGESLRSLGEPAAETEPEAEAGEKPEPDLGWEEKPEPPPPPITTPEAPPLAPKAPVASMQSPEPQTAGDPESQTISSTQAAVFRRAAVQQALAFHCGLALPQPDSSDCSAQTVTVVGRAVAAPLASSREIGLEEE